MRALRRSLKDIKGTSAKGLSVASRMMAFIIILCVAIVMIDGWLIWDGRTTEIREETTAVQNRALAIAHEASDTIGVVDIDLDTIGYWLRTHESTPAELENLHQVMQGLAAKSPQLIDLAIFDENGNRVLSSQASWPEITNNADREYFQFHKDNPSAELHFGPPVTGRASKKWLLPISRRVDHVGGGFAGVAIASLDLGYFQRFYESFDTGREGLTLLATVDGTILMRRPFVKADLGRKLVGSPLFDGWLRTQQSGTEEAPSSADGVRRIFSWQRLDPYPLVVVAGVSKNEILAAWRTEALANGAVVTLVVIAFGLLGARLSRQIAKVTLAEQAATNLMVEATRAEAHYRLLAEHSSDAIVRLGFDGRRRYVSPAIQRLLGHSPEEIAAGEFAKFIHSEDRAAVMASLAQLRDGEAEQNAVSFRCRHKNGHDVWLETMSQLVRDERTGEPVEIISSLRDISQRKCAEDALHDSEARFRFLVDSVQDYGIYMLDVTGVVKSWNSGAERIKGYRTEEVTGRHFSIFYAAEDQAAGAPTASLVTALRLGVYSAEGWRVRKDGTRFWASIVLTAVRNPAGEHVGFAKITRDLTERTVEEEQRKLIIEAAPNGMLIVDEGGVITLANSAAEKIFGYERGGMLGQPVEALVPASFRHGHVTLRTAFAGDRSARAMAVGRSLTGLRADGSELPIEVMLSPVETRRGRIVVATVVDITARRATERALQEAKQAAEAASVAKSQFLATMSHEIRSPLNGVMGFTEVLLKMDLTPVQRGYLELQREAGQGLLTVINDILDFSKLEAGKLAMTPTTMDLSRLIDSCGQLFGHLAQEKGLSLTVAVMPPGLRWINADGQRLRQIISNLLSNAIKFTSHGGVSLSVEEITSAGAPSLSIAITDTGIGIDPMNQALLFQQFSQVDGSISRDFGGTGLGLAISRRLAQLMGGDIAVRSARGAGSTFTVTLPLDKAAAPAELDTGIITTSDVDRPVAGFRILLAEDNRINQIVVEAMLQDQGLVIEVAENGAEAVAAVMRQSFDLILMDMQMPIMDGLTAARQIRQLSEQAAAIPIIALTANVLPEEVAACIAAGMNEHLGKPIDQAELLAIVEKTLRRRAA